MNQQYQADLVDMQSLSKFNDGYRYLLTCICVLSKYAWAIPLHDKNAKTVVSAFEQIFSERVSLKLQTDAEKNTKRYIGVVDKLVYSYNNTWHRSIQMTPASVTETNQSQGAKSVGKEVLKTGTQIVNDLLEGQNLEDAAKHRTKETGRKLAREAIKKADDMLGQGKKYKRKKRFSKHIIPSKARKAKGRDIFDT
ncbi:uncharacterized transposon-derived protein F54H12.3 [Trichonephila clavipes]|nr:uncharacterized transposon-derived protein F54H12.3 [Trichonephila clavipes]